MQRPAWHRPESFELSKLKAQYLPLYARSAHLRLRLQLLERRLSSPAVDVKFFPVPTPCERRCALGPLRTLAPPTLAHMAGVTLRRPRAAASLDRMLPAGTDGDEAAAQRAADWPYVAHAAERRALHELLDAYARVVDQCVSTRILLYLNALDEPPTDERLRQGPTHHLHTAEWIAMAYELLHSHRRLAEKARRHRRWRRRSVRDADRRSARAAAAAWRRAGTGDRDGG